MEKTNKKYIAFMIELGNYYYNVMPFDLKNMGATYQRMMNKVFYNEIGDMLKVYMDDMIVKSTKEVDHTLHLKKVFEHVAYFVAKDFVHHTLICSARVFQADGHYVVVIVS